MTESNRMRAVVICMALPWPINNGTRLRSWSAIKSLKDLGYDVTVIYSTPRERRDNFTELLGIKNTIYLRPGFIERMRVKVRQRYSKPPIKARYSYRRISVDSASKKLLRSLPTFDVAITEYARTASISRHIKAKHHILDSCDILSIYYKKANHLLGLMKKWQSKSSDAIVELTSVKTFKKSDIIFKERSDLRRFHSIIAISEAEFDMFRQIGLPNIKLIPPCVTMPAKEPQNYSGLPIYPMSGNLFNIQGLLHFVDRILPMILKEQPDFRIVISGKPIEDVQQCPQLVFSGYVEDLGKLYRNSGFAVIPVFNGTGQQLKIPELMSYGIPIVTYRKRVDSSVITHGQGGLLADNELEFRDHVLRLWRDRELCSELGAIGEQFATEHLSQAYFNKCLKEMIRVPV